MKARWLLTPGVAVLGVFGFLVVLLFSPFMGQSKRLERQEPWLVALGGWSPNAQSEIPAEMLARYQNAAAMSCGLPPALIAGIWKVETNHGRFGGSVVGSDGVLRPPIYGPILDGSLAGTRAIRDTDNGQLDGNGTWDRAVGGGQFLPSTWRAINADGDGDGMSNPQDVDDATLATALLLCQNGAAEGDFESAVFAYNRSAVYVAEVLAAMESYGAPTAAVASGDWVAAAANPLLDLTPNARADWLSGQLDPRIYALLISWINTGQSVSVSVFRTGHSQYTSGGSVSNHWLWRGVDIWKVNGELVRAGCAGCQAMGQWILGQPNRTTELGSPWFSNAVLPGVTFTDSAHWNHIHVGWDQ